ncbi:MAG: glycosyltransferase family 4 protein [Dokdonella sp.]
MLSLSFPAWSILALATLVVSALATRASIVYAQRRHLLDMPGRRRSHSQPTPRGGGIGIVIAVLASLVCLDAISGAGSESSASIGWLAAIALVALVGWIDDHRGLPASLRFLAHCLAALLLGLPGMFLLLPDLFANPAWPLIIMAIGVAGVGVVWSINLHNFMDGINGLLSLQVLFVFVALASVCVAAERLAEAQLLGLFAAATLGFLPFNFPQARVFMGDVGSGVLGLLVAVAVGVQIAAVPEALACGLIACSAFVVDSSATLLSRMLSGRRWYSAHREHLYQWLVRSGFSHLQVTGLYMLWNLLVVAPALFWLCRSNANQKSDSAIAVASVYTAALLIWVFGKRFCLNRKMSALRTRES